MVHGKARVGYKEARERMAQGKTNRGWQVTADNSGHLKVDNKEYQVKLQQLKERTKCFTCGKTGHWSGDPECSMKSKGGKGGSAKGGRGKGRSRPGGFLRRAGLALMIVLQ